ncbi:unnamed protein product [Aureobasidium pullulans]|nr:unnamed protein product [Aureobasidium pullulans]
MAGLGYLIPGLILGLGSSVSASPLVAGPMNSTFTNVTSNPQFSNYTSTKTILSTATIYNPASTNAVVVASIGGQQSGSSSGASNSPAHGSDSGSYAGKSFGSSVASSAVVVHVDSQAKSPASSGAFQTVIVTQTVAGCGIPTSSSTANHAPFAAALSSTTPQYAAATVQPAVHWDFPLDNLDNLIPSKNANLYYGLADPKVEHSFASVVTDMTHDTVVLDHSSYISGTSCSEEGILVSFTSTQAFNLACDSWSTVSTGLVLSTFTDGCHGDSEDQRTFWLIASLTFDNKTLTIRAFVSAELDIAQLFEQVDLVWGSYIPVSSGVPAIGGSSTSAGGAKPTSTSTSGANSGAGSTTRSGAVPTNTSTGNTTLNGSGCGAAPSSVIDGLPAIDCGDADFDSRLDDRIGYLDTTSGNYASSIEEFVPDVDFSSEDLQNDNADLTRRDIVRLQKRAWYDWPKKAIKKVGSVIVTGAQKAGNVIKAGGEILVTVASGTGKILVAGVRSVPIVGTGLDQLTGGALKDLSDFNPSIGGSQEFNYGPQASVDSPWGKAASIYSKQKDFKGDKGNVAIDLYCVDCGVKGKVSMAGQAKWNAKDGLQSLNAGINANIEAGIHLGLVASASYKDEKSSKIINQPLPEVGVSVGKLFTAGIYLSVDAKAAIDVSAEGQVLVGVVMTIPNFEAKLNLLDASSSTKSSVTGFTPTFKERFEAKGKVGAQLTLSLPIAINAGIEIPPLNMKRVLALIEEPSVYGNLTLAASTANSEVASETCNNGIEYFANLQNDVKLDFLGLKTFNLHHYDSKPLLQGCKKFDGSKATSKASSAISSEATSEASSDATSATTDASSALTTAPSTAITSPVSTAVATTEATSVATTDESSATSDASEPTATSDESGPTATDEPTTTDGADTPVETDSPEPTTTDGAETSEATDDAAPSPTDVETTSAPTEAPTPDTNESASDESLQRRHARSFLTRRQDNTTSVDDSATDDDDDNYVFDDENNYVEDFDNDVATAADLADDAIGDYSEDPDNTAFLENTAKALELASTPDAPTDANYTQLINVQKTLIVVPSTNGNLYAATYSEQLIQTNGALFGNYDNAIFGDDSGRILHFHPDEMKVYGASRLRLSDEDSIPKTADFITMTLEDVEDNGSAYFAADTYGNLYNIVMCNFANDAVSKLFVVDGQDGLDALTSNPNVKFTVTGAPVQDCYPLALIDAPAA